MILEAKDQIRSEHLERANKVRVGNRKLIRVHHHRWPQPQNHLVKPRFLIDRFDERSKLSETAARRERKPATAFLFKLISQLQFSGTVPMIDVEAYAKWLVT